MRLRLTNFLLAAVVLALIGAQKYFAEHRSAGVVRYHEGIRAAAARVPDRIGSWVGRDVPVPVQALSVLKPNVMLSRRYVDVETGLSAGVMIVHCSDAHQMVGHFPLRCYPARGWEVRASEPHDWDVSGLNLIGTQYEFSRQTFAGEQWIVVENCLLRPNGKMYRAMQDLAGTFGGPDGTSSGAAQIQVTFDRSFPPERRERAVRELLEGYKPLIEAILTRPGA